MNILVTGASGFIGSNLIAKLLKEEENVIYAVSQKSIASASKKLHPIICNLADKDFTANLPIGIDTVIHLAQSSDYKNFPDKANEIFDVNIISTHALLEWSRKTKVKKFVFSSSGNVYKPQNKLLTEDDICEPIGYYGATKYAAEQLIKPYSQFFETNILRLFGVYGPGQKHMTIPNIIQKIKDTNEIMLAGEKGLCFTPLYIDDCVEMINQTVFKIHESCIRNISGTEAIHLGILVQIICRQLNIKPLLKITRSDPMYLMGSNRKIINEISFEPKTGIEQGIAKTLNLQFHE